MARHFDVIIVTNSENSDKNIVLMLIPIKRLPLATVHRMNIFISIFQMQSEIKLVLEKSLFALI